MRKIVDFACAGETLVGSLDAAEGPTGLLIVSGGNEIRAGAHRGMAMLAARLAAEGTPVFRFDRRGVGDSSGANTGYSGARTDMEAGVAAFRHHAPRVKRIVGFGNCDGATALLLFGGKIDRLVLANPWLRDETDGLPSAEAIRARYAERLRDPGAWARALTGGVSFLKLASGLGKLATSGAPADSGVEQQVFETLRARPDTTVLISTGDATGITFLAAAERRNFFQGIELIDTDSHSFAREGDANALLAAIRAAVAD